MRDEEAQILASPVVSSTTKTSPNGKKEAEDGRLLGKAKIFKLFALSAISLLALWSVFTSSVSLKWSVSSNLNLVDHRFDSDFHANLDILEVEEREKKVKYMWKVYNRHSKGMRLPRFWHEAFEAAYEDLVSGVPATQNAAISEIAKMSMHPSLLYDVEFTESTDKTRASRKKEKKSSKVGKKG